jgi:hypothetical protein
MHLPTHLFTCLRPSFLVALAMAAACSGATTGSTGDDGGTDDGADTSTSTTPQSDGTGGVCGDGVVEGEEACDGADLGGQTCAMGGTLACTAACTLDTSGCTVDPAGAVVRLNEIVGDDVPSGPYMGITDAIELYNMGQAAADLSGWRMSDEPDLPDDKTYVFPEGSSLAPGQHLVLVRLDEKTGEGDFPFGISGSDPETLTLVDASGAAIDVASFLGPDAKVSWCRLPDGDGQWQVCGETLGESNAGGDVPIPGCGDGTLADDEECDGRDFGDVRSCADVDATLEGELACSPVCTIDLSGCEVIEVSGVVINELTSGGSDEIEIYNYGTRPFDISAYILTDDLAAPRDPYDFDADIEKLVFPPATVLEPGEFLVVVQGANPGEHPFGLSSSGDAVTLLTPGLVVVDFVEYGDGEADASYCRQPDGPTGEWTADCNPSFGDANDP